MAGLVVTVTSGKGGVGKTTAVANLGAALAKQGNKVVCVDADIGLRNLDVVLGLENRIVYDLVDIVEGRCRLRQAMILYLIPAAQTRDKSAVSPSDMVRVCEELRLEHDWILVDSPAGIERGFRNAIAPADIIVVITNPEIAAVRDADRIIGLIEAEEKGPALLIINRIKPDMVRRGDMLSADDVVELLAVELIGLIPEDQNVITSTNRGMPVTLDGHSKAGQAFTNISMRLQGGEVPFMAMDDGGGLFKKLAGRDSRSADHAKERMKLVLINDRTDISSRDMENLKDELITVISRYVEIDTSSVNIQMSHEGRKQRLIADIPIVATGRRRVRQ